MDILINSPTDPFVSYNKRGHKQVRNKKGNLLMTYKNAPKWVKFKHPAVNDYNQHLCGGWFVYDHKEFEEVDRVVAGLKPVGVSHCRDLNKTEEKQKEILSKGFMASIFKSTWNDLYFLTASPYGKLKDFFPNLDDLKEDYLCYRLPYCVEDIERYKNVDFKSFHNFKFDKENHSSCIVGLILGYPIENTIALYHMGNVI